MTDLNTTHPIKLTPCSGTTALTIYGQHPDYDPESLTTWQGGIGPVLVKVNLDGTVEFGPDYDPDEAARVFWKAIEDMGIKLASQKTPPTER